VGEEAAVFVLGAGGLMMDSGSPQIYEAIGPAAVVVDWWTRLTGWEEC